MGGMTGEIWEIFGRDKNHLSHPESPLYKGLSEDYGRDEAISTQTRKFQKISGT